MNEYLSQKKMEPQLLIILDNQSAVYFPGQTVTGTVEFDMKTKTQLRGEIL